MKVHIFVATTQGLVAIQNITAIDDEDISSIVSINGTSTTANISSAYHNFVKKGAGIIQQDFGACSYRLNIDKRIDQGNSWQLAFYLAHAANNENLLGDGQVSNGDKVICATGEINTSSKKIQRINQISLKQKLAATKIKQWHKQKINVSFLVPYDNAQDIDKKLPLNIKHIKNLAQALTHLPSKDLTPVAQSQTDNKDISTSNLSIKTRPSIKTVTKPSYWFSKKRNIVLTLATLFIFLLVVLSLLFTDNAPLEHTSNNTSTKALQNNPIKNNTSSMWQIVLLNKPENEIDQNLQAAYTVIEKTLTEQLIANNFDITDATLLTGNKNLTEQTFFQLNNVNSLHNLNSSGVNLAITFNLSVNKINNSATQIQNSVETWRYELSAYLINLITKRKIDTHTEYGEYSNNLINCDQLCFSQWFEINAKKLAQDMGAILTIKIDNLPRSYQLALTFNGFLAKELNSINSQLKVMNGFISSNIEQEFNTKKALLHQTSSQKMLYTSQLPSDDVSLALDNIFTQLGLSITKTQSNTNSQVKALVITRNNMPYLFYYIFSAVVFTNLLILLFFIQRKRTRSVAHTLAKNQNTNDEKLNTPSAVNTLGDGDSNVKTNANATDIQPIKGAVIGKGALSNYYIFTSNTLSCGRAMVDPKNSFAIGYQHISRVGKQCLFSYENKTFYIEEQGSTNGSYLNNTPLPTMQRTIINSNSHLTLGGTEEGNIAQCQLTLKIAEEQPTALIMELDDSTHPFIELSKTQLLWPSITKDLASRWVLLAEEVSLNIDNEKIVLGCSKNNVIAYLVYQNGFYIRPSEEVNDQVMTNQKIMINQHVINEKTSIVEGDTISLNGHIFSLETV